jgi:hypothetical protein
MGDEGARWPDNSLQAFHSDVMVHLFIITYLTYDQLFVIIEELVKSRILPVPSPRYSGERVRVRVEAEWIIHS